MALRIRPRGRKEHIRPQGLEEEGRISFTYLQMLNWQDYPRREDYHKK